MVFDIAVNATDPQFLGIYGGRKKHEADLGEVMSRSKSNGVQMVFLGLDLKSSIECAFLSSVFGEYSTVGIHPANSRAEAGENKDMLAEILGGKDCWELRHMICPQYIELGQKVGQAQLDGNRKTRRVIAIGEVGLDYCRLEHSSKGEQKAVFSEMLGLSAHSSLPYLFHYRDCREDFLDMVDDYSVSGVVHSFTGSAEEAGALLKKGFYIGINGASLRENVRTRAIEEIPLDRLLVESDSPWCSVRSSSPYAAYTREYVPASKKWSKGGGVRGRNEPSNVWKVIDAIAHIRGVPRAELARITEENTRSLFSL